MLAYIWQGLNEQWRGLGAGGGSQAQQEETLAAPSSLLSPPCSGHTPPQLHLHPHPEEQGVSSQQAPWESQQGIVKPIWSPGTLTAGPGS